MVSEICTDAQLKEKCNVTNVDVECGMKESQIGGGKYCSSYQGDSNYYSLLASSYHSNYLTDFYK